VYLPSNKVVLDKYARSTLVNKAQYFKTIFFGGGGVVWMYASERKIKTSMYCYLYAVLRGFVNNPFRVVDDNYRSRTSIDHLYSDNFIAQ